MRGGCSALSDFSNFPHPPAAAFAVSPPLGELRRCCQAQSCWRFWLEEEEELEEERGGGKRALPQVSGGSRGRWEAVARLRVWHWE